ncbi:MAG: 16S rRNA (cytidine(1402)-2'-O)-methyltransferase [Clostridia bacterium]|nr:16S rRNA (cytidine(1402)-2'-O)-methyltransferase [Clostridia bacterium]
MLYLVGTPIGNLGDMTVRAIETLKAVDFVCAEDTRVTAGLLSHFGIRKPLISYYEHNKLERGPQIIERLKKGENGALVTDAGMPGISDPGEHIVKLCIEAGEQYSVVPGPCAFVTGAVMSGLSTSAILFLGFLPENKKQAAPMLDMIRTSEATICLYESPYNILKTLKALENIIGGRKIALCREITKIHEEVARGTASELLEMLEETPPRGEYVVVIEGAAPSKEDPEAAEKAEKLRTGDERTVARFREEVKKAIDNGMKRNEAVKVIGASYGLSRSEAYGIYGGGDRSAENGDM